MLPPVAEIAVREIITALLAGNFDHAIFLTSKSRCSADDLAKVMEGEVTFQSASGVSRWDVVPITSDEMERWSVFVPLWDDNESSPSDLQVRLTVGVVGGKPIVTLDDILVP